jgi:uncharacterized protein
MENMDVMFKQDWVNQLRRLGWPLSACVLAWLSVSLTGCVWLDNSQRAAIYRPTQQVAQSFTGLAANEEVVYLDLSDTGNRYISKSVNIERNIDNNPGSMQRYTSAWWLPASHTQADAAPTILYFHGVFRNLTYNYPKLQALRDAGFNVLAVTYRGWPHTSAVLPSEQSIYEDAMSGWAELKRRQPDASKRILYGHSMGGGVAVEVASKLSYPKDYAALMLESTFTRLPDVASELRWYGVLLKPFATQQFDSIGKISAIKAPLLVRHGTADNTVPYVLGERLFAAAQASAQPKQFITFEGGSHSGLHDENAQLYRQSLQQFWQKISAASASR